MIDRFREEVYQSFTQRADAGMDLIDALTGSAAIESPVASSESPLFRRKFSSIYDLLNSGKLNVGRIGQVLNKRQPEDAEKVAGYEVYGLDCTDDPAAEAETLADRSQSKKGRSAATVVGHRYSWLVRLIEWRTSWCMPQDIVRVPTSSSDSQIGADQVQALAQRNLRPKVALSGNALFLEIFLRVQWVFALVRMKSNQVLYEDAPEREAGQKGRPRKHGPKFRLSAPWRKPDRVEKSTLLGQTALLHAWEGLHLYKVPFLVGMVGSPLGAVQVLNSDGTPRFKRPLILFWTGPTTVALLDLAQMYLWRFAIEHMFRCLKQQLGLTCVNSSNLAHRQLWIWCSALAYCQLLLMRHQVADQRPPWHPRHVRGLQRPIACPAERRLEGTPGQVRRQALPFCCAWAHPPLLPNLQEKAAVEPPDTCPNPASALPSSKRAKNSAKLPDLTISSSLSVVNVPDHTVLVNTAYPTTLNRRSKLKSKGYRQKWQ